ncbi:MAG: DMT family transporter, partial [Cytophagales bacterium]|nr:DMT family transporter [Cytophagales bacterium]
MKKVVLGGIYIFIGSFCFSTKAIMIKLAYNYPGVDAVSVLMLRMLFSLPFFVIIGFWNSRCREVTTLTKADWLKLLALGFVGYYVSSILDFKGLEYVSAGLERLILFAYPTIVLIISALFYKRPIKGYQYMALILTYIGIGIAVFPDLGRDSGDLVKGILMVIGAAITYAIYLVESGEI